MRVNSFNGNVNLGNQDFPPNSPSPNLKPYHYIELDGEICWEMAYRISNRICKLSSHNPYEDICLLIKYVWGGSYDDGFLIYDTINYVEAKVDTVCERKASSIGSFILIAGKERLAYPHAEINIYQPESSFRDLRDSKVVSRNKRVQEMAMATRRSNMNLVFKAKTGNDMSTHLENENALFMSAREAKSLGILTGIAGIDKRFD